MRHHFLRKVCVKNAIGLAELLDVEAALDEGMYFEALSLSVGQMGCIDSKRYNLFLLGEPAPGADVW